MKRNIFYTVLVAILLLFTGCEKNFDAKLYGTLSTLNYPASESDYENYLMGCYVPFSVHWGYTFGDGSGWQHNFYVAEGGIIRMLDSTSDCNASYTVNTWGGTWVKMSMGQFDDLKLVTRKSGGNPSHFDKVREITRFTQIIETLEQGTGISDAKKTEFIAEARLLRGMMMYYLLHFYGPVPVILDGALIGNNEAEAKMVRPTLDEMTTYITDDLAFAADNMVEKQAKKGRYTADYARYCLMRHYLNEGAHITGYYEKAYNLFSQFTGTYSLHKKGDNPYADQFKVANKFNSEVVMAVSCSSTADGSATLGNFNPLSLYIIPSNASKIDDKGNPTPFVNQGGGWTQAFSISPQFYDTFEPNDQRKETILTSYYTKDGVWVTREDIGRKWNGFIINKFPLETATAFQGTDIPLARWADVLLLYAEADVRKNNSVSATAISSVNEVRERAGLGKLPTSATASVGAFLDALLQERGHELMYEGCRKVDLIRFNKYYTVMKSLGRTPSSQYFPIPDYAVLQASESGHTLDQYFTRNDYDGSK